MEEEQDKPIVEKPFTVYVKIARAGGTSFLNALGAHGEWFEPDMVPDPKRLILAHTVHSIGETRPEILEQAHVFAIVRDPYDRAESGWKHVLPGKRLLDVLKDPPQWPKDFAWPDMGPPPWSPALRRPCSLHTHFTCTVKQKLTWKGVTYCDSLVRLENASEELEQLFHDRGLQLEHPLRGSNSSRRGRFHEWSREELDLATELFAEDLDFLGYPRR